MLWEAYGQHKLDLMIFLGGVDTGGRVDVGRVGSKCYWVTVQISPIINKNIMFWWESEKQEKIK